MKMRKSLALLVIAGALTFGAESPSLGQEFEIPQPISTQHLELHARIEAAVQSGGATGKAARAVMDALAPHFEKEEKYALPQLGLLPGITGIPGAKARELTSQEREDLMARTERFRAELPKMLEEHKAIGAALQDLHRAADAENKLEQVQLAEEIRQHAQTEEQLLYPAALLIGEYFALKGSSAH
jgi:Hemerythrin HHE cation binding domain